MGYESIEKDSLITLKLALQIAMKGLKKSEQLYKDMNYEMQRIESVLE